MRGVVVIALGVGFAGCAEPAAPLDPKVYLTRPETEYQVNGTAFQMSFPRDDGNRTGGVQLPYALYLGGDTTNALGNTRCPGESLVGIGLYPAAIVAGDTDATASNAGTGGIAMVHEGPAVMSLAVSYTVPYTCSSGAAELVGTSTFTFFPSSRIVRHDSVTPAAANVASTAGCNECAPTATGWYFTSFWTFATDTIVNPEGTALGEFEGAPSSCVQINSNVVAVAWHGTQPTRAMHPSQQSASVYDFQPGGSTLTSGLREATSSIQIGFERDAASQCDDVLGTLSRAPLRVNGARVELNEHGIYVDPAVHRGTIEITAQDGDVAPFAVILDLGSARHARVNGRTVGQYMIQDVPSTDTPNDFLFWFDDGISNFAEPFTIEPY